MMSTSIQRCSVLFLLLCLTLFIGVSAQSSSPASSTSTPTVSFSVGNTTITSVSLSGQQTVSYTTVVPTTYNVSLSATSTSASAATSSAAPIVLNTKLDPGFGVLGALLILTGIPSAFLGHKNRWTSFFLVGFYTLSLVCLVLILKFGVLGAVNPPSTSLRGLFVLACAVAGAAGGAVAVFFWKAARYFIGGWGGFVVGLFVQCFRNGGLIGPIGFRWIMYIVCGVVGFCLCTVPKIHHQVLLVSTALVGATSFMLGVDCFSAAGLKEFYMWNLGFEGLFPKYTQNHISFPVTQTMEIELGLMGAVAVVGIAVQLRVFKILKRKLEEIAAEQKKRDEEAEVGAAERFDVLNEQKAEWERKHGRQQSDYSSMDRLKRTESSSDIPASDDHSTDHLAETRSRNQSRTSDFMTTMNPRSQSPGAIPVLDFGDDIQKDVPTGFLSDLKGSQKQEPVPISAADIASRDSLLAEIQNIRRSIDVLKSESPTNSYTRSNRPSVTSRRTLSQDLNNVVQYRAGSQLDTRSRVQSLEMRDRTGSSIVRPTSVPLQENWDSYVQNRTILQPPSGITAPIPTTPIPIGRLSMPVAVLDAVAQRQQRENMMTGRISSDDPRVVSTSDDNLPLVKSRHSRTRSAGTMPVMEATPAVSSAPVKILPPRNVGTAPVAPTPQKPRVATYEELSERHREKMRKLQAPLTQAENEQEELANAKGRWERAKGLEREAMTKRQADVAATLGKKRKSEDLDAAVQRRPRSLSVDKLNAVGGSTSKRLSAMKVEDWKKHQEEFGELAQPHSKKGSLGTRQQRSSGVPFPENSRDSRLLSNHPRDPPR